MSEPAPRRYPVWAAAASWAALPVYVWQGLATRLSTERMHPAAGPVTGRIDGVGDEIRLLVIGDSSAAGVGVEDTQDGLAARLAEELVRITGRSVTWRAAGSNSATCAQVRDHVVPNVAPRDFTHVVISCGTNDMKNFHRVGTFRRDFGTLLYALKARFPEAQVFWSQMVDMRLVPSLPQALGLILDIRVDALNAKGARLCRERGVTCIGPVPIEGPDGFARDGFHAGAEGYKAMARHVAAAIAGIQRI